MGRKSAYLDNLRRYGVSETDVPDTDVEALKKQFTSLTEALDQTPSELGAAHYKKAKQKTLTLRNIKRKKLPDLMAVFEKGIKLADDEEEQKSESPSAAPEDSKASQEKAAEATALVLVESDKELAVLIIDVIHEAFYNPKTGFWPGYDAKFDLQAYLKAAKPGWDAPTDTPERQAARDEINRLKNLETATIMESEFVKGAADIVQETLLPVVSGVKARDIKHAIRNHVRDHLNKLIFGDLK